MAAGGFTAAMRIGQLVASVFRQRTSLSRHREESAMGEPATTIDTRFSESGAAPTPWSQTRRVKWDGRWQFRAGGGRFHHPDGDGEALVYAVAPAKVLAFGKGHFTHTSHRF
jgi:hypothetical protein